MSLLTRFYRKRIAQEVKFYIVTSETTKSCSIGIEFFTQSGKVDICIFEFQSFLSRMALPYQQHSELIMSMK